MALNRVVESPDDYKPQIDHQEAIGKRVPGDRTKLVKLMQKQRKIHTGLCDIFEAHDFDLDAVRKAFTDYGEAITDLYSEVVDE